MYYPEVINYIKIFLFALFFAVLLHLFVVEPYIVPNNTMAPFYRKGEVLLIDKISAFGRDEIILFRDINNENNKYLRRIIGLPGERIIINDGILSIRGADTSIIREMSVSAGVITYLEGIGRLDDHEYFVLPEHGFSRPLGMIDGRYILGRPIVKIWPAFR